jgi:hypothetical protein
MPKRKIRGELGKLNLGQRAKKMQKVAENVRGLPIFHVA